MAKATRSPLLGYNHNVKYKGRVFHVQTEDSGPGIPHLFTHLFFEGTILASKKLSYDGDSSEDTVRALMQAQHKAILKELKQEVYDEKLTTFFETRGEPLFVVEAEETTLGAETPPNTLDLDALPAATGDTPPPEPAPPDPALRKSAPPGPGVYSERRNTADRPFAPPTPQPEAIVAPSKKPSLPPQRAPGAASQKRPSVPPQPATPARAASPTSTSPRMPPPAAPPRPPARAPTIPPVVPVVAPAPPAGVAPPERLPLRPPTLPPRSVPAAPTSPPIVPRRIVERPRRPSTPVQAPVVVQRTVVVGAGTPAAPTPPPVMARQRRPAQAIPYVVREGSHPVAQTVRPQPQPQPPAPPPRPLIPQPGPPPRTAVTAPTPPPAIEAGDRSLDDVILAYLQQGEPKR